MGNYLILHCEKELFYGWETVLRGFEGLQTNGVYIGSGGAGANKWMTIQFDNGSWREEVLAEEDWEDFDQWNDETADSFESIAKDTLFKE